MYSQETHTPTMTNATAAPTTNRSVETLMLPVDGQQNLPTDSIIALQQVDNRKLNMFIDFITIEADMRQKSNTFLYQRQ